MTTTEGTNFIHTVLISNWPKWEFSENHEAEWARRLKPYDFNKARRLVNDFAFHRTKLGIPPAGLLFKAMEKAFIPKDRGDSEPIDVFEIIKEGNVRGYRFALSSRRLLPRDPQEMERIADRARDRCEELFSNVKWIVLQKWQKYYEERECPI